MIKKMFEGKSCKLFVMGFIAAIAVSVTANTVKVTKFHQSYPYSGKATIEYTVSGELPANAAAEIILNTDDASATFTQKNIVAGANRHIIDFASSFGGALVLTNASFVVTIKELELGGVQLWENGPYWAECNVGATKPEEYGYYFWWGDAVGYKRENDKWVASDGSNSNFSFSSGNAPTYGKDNSSLLSAGYIDSTGNLAPAHDAATVQLGSPWRMPTKDEIDALINNCTTTWTTKNGVYGRLVTGKGTYSDKSIFLPAAGYGYASLLSYAGSYGNVWSSTPDSGNSDYAWYLSFGSGYFDQYDDRRYDGQAVRPLREFAECCAIGAVTYDLPPSAPVISPASGMTFDTSLTVSILCETEGAAIYYTTDGSEPTKDSTAYKRFRIYGKTTVKAVAYDAENDLYSEVTTANYALGSCENPVIAPNGGSVEVTEGGYVFYHDGQTVTISRNGEEGTIRYTLDGSEPTAESAVYSESITLDDTTTIKAKVFSDRYFDSETVSITFTREWEQVSTPNIIVAPTFTGSKTKCEITCNTDGAKIYYTLDGSNPTSHSQRYTGALYITESCTLKAIALLKGYLNSEIVEKSVTKVWGIGDTMGAPDHAFTTSGDGGKVFYRVEVASAPGGEAMRSGDIGNSDDYGTYTRTVLSTKVIGPGTVNFSWKASCEYDELHQWDCGEFAVDGVVKAHICGETEWKSVSVTVEGSGEHTLSWTYLKDYAEFGGEDCIWVTGFGWTSAEAYTHTTNVKVPYEWLLANWPDAIDEYEAYETAAKATAANGRKVWECYVLGLDPTDPSDDFRITRFWMENGEPKFEFNHTTDGSGNSFLPYVKPLGKAQFTDKWRHVPEGGNPAFRFFTVEVVPPGCESSIVEEEDLGGVQLWENGPYWAECNVGATKPEEYGYYFWWGDTVGYVRIGGLPYNGRDLEGVTWVSSKGEQMSNSPFTSLCPTYGKDKDNAALLFAGCIDSTGNLTPEHDAATAHLGSPWRMPTSAEISALRSNCTTTWTRKNGVYGRLVTGKGAYADKSIFFPAGGYGGGSFFYNGGSYGYYWFSTPNSNDSYYAWGLFFGSGDFDQCSGYYRYFGQSVRPVRDCAK